jgi:branched-chain amino acid transport system substrate-binding protein
VKYVNANGGVNGKPVKLIVLDNASDPARGIQTVNQLVQSGSSIIIGGAFIGVCDGIAATVAKLGVPDICMSPTDLATAAPPYQYGIIPSGGQHDNALYKYLVSRNIKKVGVQVATDVSGQEGTAYAKAAERAYGITADIQSTSPAATNFTSQLEHMIGAGVQAIYMTSCGGVSITAAQEAVSLKFKGPIILDNCFSSEGVAQSIKGFVNGNVMILNPEFMLGPPYTAKRRSANNLYNQKVGTKDITVADGWDTVLLVAGAAKQAHSVDSKKLNQTLQNNFTFYGTVAGGTFIPTNHRNQDPAGVYVPSAFTKEGGFTRLAGPQ